MIEKRTGGCHCKMVRYEVEVDLSQPVLECNCSHCEVKGLLLAFVSATSVRVLSGEDALTEYRFNTEKLQHLFCKKCGVEPFARGEKEGVVTYGLNVRSIDEVNLAALTRAPFDGRSR